MTKDDKVHRKQMILEYLADIPVYKWAAKYVRIDEDTLTNWKHEDKEFSDACQLKISEFVRRTAKRAKPEFQLERMLKKDFGNEAQPEVQINNYHSMTDEQLDRLIAAKAKQDRIAKLTSGEGETDSGEPT